MKGSTLVKQAIKSIIPNDIMTHRLDRSVSDSILLTFDDGPDRDITPAVLHRLEDYRARAIFFVVGYKVEQLPHLLRLIKDQGHLVGNHSYHHPKGRLPGLMKVRPYRRDLIRCQEVIEKTIGEKPVLFRPPRGLTPASLLAARSLDLRTVLYSIEGGEWGRRKASDAETIGKELSRTLGPRDIVLLHDDNWKVPAVLDMILPAIKDRNLDIYSAVDHFR